MVEGFSNERDESYEKESTTSDDQTTTIMSNLYQYLTCTLESLIINRLILRLLQSSLTLSWDSTILLTLLRPSSGVPPTRLPSDSSVMLRSSTDVLLCLLS